MRVRWSPDAPRPVALVRRGFSPTGGAEKFLARFAAAAAKTGRHLVLVTDRPWPEEARVGMPQTVLRGKTPGAFAASVARWRKTWGDGIVFSFERLQGADCYRAGDGVHVAWMRRRREYDPPVHVLLRRISGKHRDLVRLEKNCFSAAHTGAVIVNSLLVREEIERIYGYPAARIHLVRNGVPEDYAAGVPGKREARRLLGLPETGFVAAFAGTGWKRKGLRYAIAALDRAGLSDAKLAVAGRGRRPALSGPGVVFLGPLRDVRPLLSAADAFILPTVYDPFSNACLEALAVGRPVITSAANGCAEIIREGITGSVVQRPDAIGGLATALEYWARDGRAAAAEADCREAAAACSLAENVRCTLEILEGIGKG
ncbi:MAG: glycosyltransferase family 4 protein [Chthoniobacterales bacterium]